MFIPKNNVFIMSHMRSRSSLLNHLLINHKDIDGIGESNKVYRSKMDFIKMRIKTILASKFKTQWNFIFVDQINHNNKTPNIKVIDSYAKLIFLYRNPEETFESIRLLTKEYYKEWSHSKIEKYYINRLKFLIQLRNSTPNSISVESDELIYNSLDCFNKLETFLAINEKFSTQYLTKAFTGIKGDPSEIISKGKIIKSAKKTYQLPIDHECFSLYNELRNANHSSPENS